MAEHNENPAPEPSTAPHPGTPGTATREILAALVTRAQTPDEAAESAISSDPDAVPGYQLLGEIGKGGMGVVYRAKQIAFDRDVAIKVLKGKYAHNAVAAQRFQEEARITGQLQHPNIPAVHDLGTLSDGRPFLAMKLINGDTLAELLERRADPTTDRGRLVGVFEQVCQAVAYAHAHKVIHRDLKPQNIMVGKFGEVQVMDWGLAKVLSGDSREHAVFEHVAEATEIRGGRQPDSATQAGAVMGTLAYMAAEQAGGEVDKIDKRADVFGLGAVLCTILTGRPPYAAPDTEAVRLQAIRGDTTDCFERLDACGADPELVALCKRCLATQREARPRDASTVADAVAAHLATVAERARQAELDHVRAEEQRKQRRTQFALAGAVLLLLVLFAFGTGLAALWRVAESARNQLAAEKKLTEEARDDALELKRIAEKAHASETAARKDAENEREKVAAFAHGRTIQLAHQEWRDNNIRRALALLNDIKPELRGWEWCYVQRLCHEPLLTLKNPDSRVLSVSFSPDGSRVVTGCGDRKARVWDVRTGALVLELKGHTSWVNAAAFSPDGTRIVTAGQDGTVRVWEVPATKPEGVAQTQKELFAIAGHTSWVNSAQFSPDGSRIVTASADKTARVWDAKTGAELLILKGHTDVVTVALFSADGSRIVTGSDDRTARVWEVLAAKPEGSAQTGTELLALRGHRESVLSVSFSPDGSRVVTGCGDRKARVWDVRTGALVLELKGHTSWVNAAAFSPDGTRIVTAGQDETVRFWDAKSGDALLTLDWHTSEVTSACFSPDGLLVVTGSADRTVQIWAARTTEAQVLRGHEGDVRCASFSADGAWIVTGGRDSTVRIWDAKTGAEWRRLTGHEHWVTAASFDPGGSRVVTGSADGTARVWNTDTGRLLLELKGHSSWVNSAEFSADGSRVVTGSADGTARIWSAKTGALLLELKGHGAEVLSAEFSLDGSRVVTGSADKTARVWEVPATKPEGLAKAGTVLLELKGHDGDVRCASFNADGSRVVTGSADGTVRVWGTKTGAELLRLGGRASGVHSARFSPDESRIVTAGKDKTARVWDAKTGAELLTLKGHTDEVTAASFSPDGSRIVTAGHDGTARVWTATPLSREFLPPDATTDRKVMDRR